ncbi:hypothetical protein KR222_008093 [Zaprionus bogoriensis]|nr:hypothetical protein KR222_008093 [Zaprionus bogoriensis]
MPIGKIPQCQPIGRKLSAAEPPSMDSTIDSRVSSSELLPMELLKVNYVHQCKQAMMRKSNEPPSTPHLNNPARFLGYRRQPPQLQGVTTAQVPRAVRLASSISPNSARKPLPALPPPTVESWLFLAKQPQQVHSAQANESDCCCSQSACSCSDSDVTEASTVIPDCEKSQSWNYRDVRRDLIHAGNVSGVKSRADRIARIERKHFDMQPPLKQKSSPDCSACARQSEQERSPAFGSNRVTPRSLIPKPIGPRNQATPNAKVQRSVKQMFQPEVVHSHSAAPRWMFQKAGGCNSNSSRQAMPEQQSPRLQQKSKLERVHIRKKRQPLHIVNQLAGDSTQTTQEVVQEAKISESYKPQKHNETPKTTLARGERMKRFSLESCSDSGVSSSNDTKEQQIKQSNVHSEEKCIDYVQVIEGQMPGKHNLKQPDRASAGTQLKPQADPNDVQNFAKKNVTKATTNELLTAAAIQSKQCNIEREKNLNRLNYQCTKPAAITISIDDTWVRESTIDPCDDYMETDSLMLPSTPLPKTQSSNRVKIFVCSDDTDADREELRRASRTMELSSRNSMSSSGCGGSSRDNSSLCESEKDYCSCSGQQCESSKNCSFNDCCNAVGGVFWNNACYEVEVDPGPACCCSLSSCDDDDCSYYEGNFSAELEVIQDRHSDIPLRNKKPLRKTGTHEFRPRSMDGVIDSGVSLNGDTGSSPDSGEHTQNQQDAEARTLKRGHVLSELLETERIYVNEMSSILKVNIYKEKKCTHYIKWVYEQPTPKTISTNMRYGGYDLHKASEPKTSGVQSAFRLRRVHRTACNIVDRFNLKFGDSLIRRFNLPLFDREEPRQSPLSFQGSLFDSQTSCGGISYRPADFRPRFDDLANLGGSYVFGTNLYNFATHNILNGKSTIKIINTLKECEERETLDSGEELELSLQGTNIAYNATVNNSLQRLKDQRRTIFKGLIELSSCDESLEYQLVKDYLESNSYSEIENDAEFKDYLQRKNYVDILAYLEDSEPKSFMSISSSVARAQSSLGSLNHTKLLSTPKSLKAPKKILALDAHMCKSCRSSLQNSPKALLSLSDNRESSKERETEVADSYSSYSKWNSSYREIVTFCNQFFEENCKKPASQTKNIPKFKDGKFKLAKYEQILKEFVVAQGYPSVEEYVHQKFGQFINSNVHSFFNQEQAEGYFDRMQSEELMHLVPTSLQGKEEVLFGNLHELFTFHNEVFLKDLENCISTTELVALCFVQRRDTFYRLYSFYCQNIPRSERLRETLVDTHLFLQECQKKLGHKLPLAAYLLKPVQRITKYQLLLKDLLRFSDSGSCTKELQKALDCMLIVLKCVNDSMHQVAITGFPTDLAQQGELLLQDSFQVWTESKKDIRLRIKPQQRHIFLYQKSLLFCKQTSKTGHNKSTYQFKHHVKMSQIGLTESVRGDTKRFEVWLQGRQEVHTMQAPSIEVKNKWVAEIKRVLLNQLEELKGEKIKQYGLNHRGFKQTTSWDTPNIILGTPNRTISCDASSESSNRNSNCSSEESGPAAAACAIARSGAIDRDHQDACGWSSDYSNSEDEISLNEDNSTPGSKFIALADYTAMGHSEVSIREGEAIELLKVGCAGWWYVRVLDNNSEGWTPGAYLESVNRKSSRSSSCNQERLK